MLKWMAILLATAMSLVRPRSELALENLALRQQLATFKHRRPPPRLSDADRFFWILLSRFWKGWRDVLHIVQPDTVVRWHRHGFRYSTTGAGRVEVEDDLQWMQSSEP